MTQEKKNETQPSAEKETNKEVKTNEVNIALETCQQEAQAWKDKFLHVRADFDNFTKRMAKERAQWESQAQAMVLKDVLNVVDNFDRAFAEAEKEALSDEMKSWLAGYEMIHKDLYKFLEKFDVKEIEASKEFNPETHEAITQIDSPEHESGSIIDVMQKGFTFKSKVLRPAKVVVAK